MMLRGHPLLIGGAPMLPNIRTLEAILGIVFLWQPATCAICDVDGSSQWIMSYPLAMNGQG
jgi:hypothetical protein